MNNADPTPSPPSPPSGLREKAKSPEFWVKLSALVGACGLACMGVGSCVHSGWMGRLGWYLTIPMLVAAALALAATVFVVVHGLVAARRKRGERGGED